MEIPAVNLQALLAIAFFIGALLVARMVVGIHAGKWPGGAGIVAYLRMLVGFLLVGALYFGLYSFAGVDVISGR